MESHPGPRFPETELRRREAMLGRSLMDRFERDGVDLEGSGIIGHTVLRERPPVVMPSQIYWPTLVRWQIVSPDMDRGEPPGRQTVHAEWHKYAPTPAERRRPIEGEPERPLLFDLPVFRDDAYPLDWRRREEKGITFDLQPEERAFLADKISRLNRADGEPCLLARLAPRAARRTVFERLYSDRVRALCDEPDRAALRHAHCAGLLGQMVRSIYAALVEEMRQHDGISTDTQAREFLKSRREDADAVRAVKDLDVDDLQRDGVSIDEELRRLLVRVQNWITTNAPATDLLTVFRNRERGKKTAAKARLEPLNRERRKAKQQPVWTPEPLTYRWGNVQWLLNDLAGVR